MGSDREMEGNGDYEYIIRKKENWKMSGEDEDRIVIRSKKRTREEKEEKPEEDKEEEEETKGRRLA